MKSEAEILLAIRSDVRGAAQAIESLKATHKAALGVGDGFRAAAGAAGAYGLYQAFEQSAKAAVLFNAKLEDTQLGLAGIYRQFRPKEFTDFEKAMGASSKTVDQLKKAALETTATFEDLLTAYQSIAGAAFSAGIPMEKHIRLTQMLSHAVAGLGLPSWQLPQEGRSILTGTIGPDSTVARALGITNEMVTQARAQGRLMEFLEQRLSGLSEAGSRANRTFSGQLSNLKDRFGQMMGEASAPAFDALKAAFIQIGATLARPEVQQGLNSLGALAAKGIESAGNFLSDPGKVDSALTGGQMLLGVAGGGLLAKALARILPSASSIGYGIGAAGQIGANTLSGLATTGTAAPLNSIFQRLTAGGGAFGGTGLGALLTQLSATGSAGTTMASIGVGASAGLLGLAAAAGGGLGYLLSPLVSEKFAGNLGAGIGFMSEGERDALHNGDGILDIEGRIRRYREKLAAREKAAESAKAPVEDKAETEHRLRLGRTQMDDDFRNKRVGFEDYFGARYFALQKEADLRFGDDKVGRRRFLESGSQDLVLMAQQEEQRRAGNVFDRLRVKSDFNSGRFANAGSLYGFANGLPTFKAMLDELRSIRNELRGSRAALT
jgi:hypothetical protein